MVFCRQFSTISLSFLLYKLYSYSNYKYAPEMLVSDQMHGTHIHLYGYKIRVIRNKLSFFNGI